MSNAGWPATQWQSLAQAADRGELFLDPVAAQKCNQACALYIAKLVEHKSTAEGFTKINGWGEFQAGRDLRRIFARKAVGGENNMVDVLESHIAVVKEMQAVFQKFFVVTTDGDEANADGVGQAGAR